MLGGKNLGSQLGTNIFKGKEKYYFNILKSCFEICEKKKDMNLDTMEKDRKNNSSSAKTGHH